MTWQKVGLYYVLAAVLGSYFFLFEWRPPKKGGLIDPAAGPTAQQSQFLPIAREDIHGLVLKRPNVSLCVPPRGTTVDRRGAGLDLRSLQIC